MDKATTVLIIGLIILSQSVCADEIGQLHNLGYVVVSPGGPDDGGDFGPNTPDTQTSGIQEAFDYAKANVKEVYIIGGSVDETGSPVVYDIDMTLTIPWGQDWHCDGGNYVLNFTQSSGDCLVIDSQMNCQFRFGVISATNLESGSVVAIRPTTIGPDNFIVIISSIINITGIIGGGNASSGKGIGLYVDSSIGPVISSHISVGEIVGCETGILIQEGLHDTINCPNVRQCNTHLMVNGSPSYNKITLSMDPNNLGGTVVGANLLGGIENIYNLTWQGGYDPCTALIFGSNAMDNIVYAMGLPLNGVTNNAITPTNRIVPTKPVGFGITTPAIPGSDAYVVNRESYSVIATILTPGTVTSWTIKDSSGISQTITSGLLAGQTFYLEPGDAIKFNYSAQPTWAWRALR